MVLKSTIAASTLITGAAGLAKQYGADIEAAVQAASAARTQDCANRELFLKDTSDATGFTAARYGASGSVAEIPGFNTINDDTTAKAFCETGGHTTASNETGAWCFFTDAAANAAAWDTADRTAGAVTTNVSCVAGDASGASATNGLTAFYAYNGANTVAALANFAAVTGDVSANFARTTSNGGCAGLADTDAGCNNYLGGANVSLVGAPTSASWAKTGCYLDSNTKCTLDTTPFAATTGVHASALTTTTGGERESAVANLALFLANGVETALNAVRDEMTTIPTGVPAASSSMFTTLNAAGTTAVKTLAKPLCESVGGKWTEGVADTSAAGCGAQSSTQAYTDAHLNAYANYQCGAFGAAIRAASASYTAMAANASGSDTAAVLKQKECEKPSSFLRFVSQDMADATKIGTAGALNKTICKWVSSGLAHTAGTTLTLDDSCTSVAAPTTSTSDASSAAAVSTAALAAGLFLAQ